MLRTVKIKCELCLRTIQTYLEFGKKTFALALKYRIYVHLTRGLKWINDF